MSLSTPIAFLARLLTSSCAGHVDASAPDPDRLWQEATPFAAFLAAAAGAPICGPAGGA